jgi:hypothetical protein
MTKTEIKKALYKEKPTAKRGIVSSVVYNTNVYRTTLADGTDVKFSIPDSEWNSDTFQDEMPAQLLIRWLDAV